MNGKAYNCWQIWLSVLLIEWPWWRYQIDLCLLLRCFGLNAVGSRFLWRIWLLVLLWRRYIEKRHCVSIPIRCSRKAPPFNRNILLRRCLTCSRYFITGQHIVPSMQHEFVFSWTCPPHFLLIRGFTPLSRYVNNQLVRGYGLGRPIDSIFQTTPLSSLVCCFLSSGSRVLNFMKPVKSRCLVVL